MKKIIYLLMLICSISLFAQDPIVKLYLEDKTTSFNLSEIDNINFVLGKSVCLMKIYYQDTLMTNFQTKNIESIKFEKDNFKNDLLNIYIGGKPNSFLLAEIDSINFFVPQVPIPQIASITPTSGMVGDIITIDGSNFGATQGTSIFSFKSQNASEISLWSDTKIKLKVPKGAMSGPVSVTVNSIKSNEVDFNLIHNIISLNPNSGRAGDVISITGQNLGKIQDKSFASFDNINAATYQSWSDSLIKLVVPNNAKNCKVTVTVAGVKSNGLDFAILPTIFSLSSTSFKIGDTLSIKGTSFGFAKDTCLVYFNDKKFSAFILMNDSLIKLKVPAGVVSGKIYMTTKSIKSNELDFSILPQITKVAPTSAAIDDQILITGTGFGASGSSNFIYFNALETAKFTKWTDTEIGLAVPNGATSGKLSIKVNNVKSNEVDFTVIHKLISISPKNSGKIGDEIAIIGTNFGISQGASYINLNNLKITDIKSWSDTEIKLIIPTNANTGKISVTINGIISNELQLSIIPDIKSINPTSAAFGGTVTIAGTGFNEVQGTGFVAFTRANANEYVNWNSTQIVCKVPNGSRSGKLSVTSGDQKSNEVDFSLLLSMTGIFPTSGVAGDEITILGVSFGDTKGSSFVSFNGTNAIDYISWTDTEIHVKVPANATTGKLSVTVGSTKSNEVDFTLTPQLTSITPSSANIGEFVSLSGNNFGTSQGTGKVTFNGVNATVYQSWSNNLIMVKVPNATTGKVSVSVNDIKSNEVDFTITSIVIGTQEWMNRNLDLTTYKNGDQIPQCTDQSTWNTLTTGAWCYYNNSSGNATTYGILYNWYAVSDPRGLGPTGWHVSSDADWTTLTDYLGGLPSSGGPLKEVGTLHWTTPNAGATNTTLFTALPAGYRLTSFDRMGDACIFWTTISNDATTAWTRALLYNSGSVSRSAQGKTTGFPVRCVKD